MKRLVIITLLFIYSAARGQEKVDARSLVKSVTELNRALIMRDTVALNALLDDNLEYKHSNGWIQLKQDIKNDLYNGKILYKQISQSPPKLNITEAKDTAYVDADARLEVIFEHKPVAMELHISQVWRYTPYGWRLWRRKSIKI